MWKLTITQKRKSELTDAMFEDRLIYVGKDLNEFTTLIVRLSKYENGLETSYNIERVCE